jgi:predicted HAD superfamily Cof-like phosphohydrolase
MKKTNAEKIIEFQIAMNGEAPDKPTFPDERLLGLRRRLIQEEYVEVDEAFERLAIEPTKAALAHLMHECADLLYVTYGAMVSLGVDADAVFAEVHRANMQKAGGPRRPDGKVLKPENFVRADVGRIIFGAQ